VRYFQKHKDKKAANNKLYWERHPDKAEQHKKKFREKNGLYSLWAGMNNRCHNPKDHAYKDYGGRGISVCHEWRGPGGYQQFMKDMPPRPTRRHTLDRIDNQLGYSRDNCKWSTREEQGANKRTTKLVTLCGRTQTKSQWSRELGMSPTGFNNRLQRGWSEEEILQPVNAMKQPPLSKARLLENAAVMMYQALRGTDYENQHKVESILREIGLIPKLLAESSGTHPPSA